MSAEPVHTRALGVRATRRDDGAVEARGYLIDLRTRGFLPVGGSMQGMGIIHHMEFRWVVDPATGVVRSLAPAQPTVAFEASPETEGESCRDPIGRLAAVAGKPLGKALTAAMREEAGGPVGCSHLVTLAFFMDAALRAGLARVAERLSAAPPAASGTLFQRDLVFDARARDDDVVVVVMRQNDLDWNDAPAGSLAPERFARHHELDATLDVHLWPGSLLEIGGRERVRTAAAFVGVGWEDRTPLLASLRGLGLARGAAGEIAQRLGEAAGAAPWRDALLMLAPALVQCRAAHPDAWHEKVRTAPRHPGLTALPDSCYMWRRDGALERIRKRLGAGKGGR
ncbi:MAG TPA: DUF2889 domain-containing protein [Candidatus Limnocylindria bacterium]|nr:DUF2889 domain-containing protein [Candidatus Limnocylindria bacterium]